MKVTIQAKINNTEVSIVTDLVNDHIPLLLSKEAMKKANKQIGFSSDSVFMFGTKQSLLVTTSGHYTIPIGERASLEEVSEKDQRIILHAKTADLSSIEKTLRTFIVSFMIPHQTH